MNAPFTIKHQIMCSKQRQVKIRPFPNSHNHTGTQMPSVSVLVTISFIFYHFKHTFRQMHHACISSENEHSVSIHKMMHMSEGN